MTVKKDKLNARVVSWWWWWWWGLGSISVTAEVTLKVLQSIVLVPAR